MQRMIVVPPTVFEKWKKIFVADKQLSDLDLEMKRVLYSKNMNNTDKWHLYRQNLMRYLMVSRKKREQTSEKPLMIDKDSQYDKHVKDEKIFSTSNNRKISKHQNLNLPFIKKQRITDNQVLSQAEKKISESANESENDEYYDIFDEKVNDNTKSINDLDETIKIPPVTRSQSKKTNALQSETSQKNDQKNQKQIRWTPYK